MKRASGKLLHLRSRSSDTICDGTMGGTGTAATLPQQLAPKVTVGSGIDGGGGAAVSGAGPGVGHPPATSSFPGGGGGGGAVSGSMARMSAAATSAAAHAAASAFGRLDSSPVLSSSAMSSWTGRASGISPPPERSRRTSVDVDNDVDVDGAAVVSADEEDGEGETERRRNHRHISSYSGGILDSSFFGRSEQREESEGGRGGGGEGGGGMGVKGIESHPPTPPLPTDGDENQAEEGARRENSGFGTAVTTAVDVEEGGGGWQAAGREEVAAAAAPIASVGGSSPGCGGGGGYQNSTEPRVVAGNHPLRSGVGGEDARGAAEAAGVAAAAVAVAGAADAVPPDTAQGEGLATATDGGNEAPGVVPGSPLSDDDVEDVEDIVELRRGAATVSLQRTASLEATGRRGEEIIGKTPPPSARLPHDI